MIESLNPRTLIIGNSGSGKSTRAEGLGARIHAPVFDLDLIHWKDDGSGAKQDEDLARQKVAHLATTTRWVLEGVYGWLAEVAIPRATVLIWLDVPWDVCRDGLLARGQRRGGTVRLIMLTCSNGQKPTGIAKRPHLSRDISVYSKPSVLPNLDFGTERRPITFSPL